MSDPSWFEVPIPAPPADLAARTAALEEALDERVLVLDGATGTALQGITLTADDFGGPELEGCNEVLCATRPDVVDMVHETYLAAGCDVVETNSFGSTPLVLAEYDIAHRAFELSELSARLARTAAARHDQPGSAALRVRRSRTDHQGAVGHRRRHLRGIASALPRAGPRPDGGRRRLSAARDLPGHPQHQGRAAGLRNGIRRSRLASAGRGVGDHRDHRHHARGAGRRGARGLAAARGSALRRPQLRDRSGADERPSAHALGGLPHAHRLRAQRRAAGRGGQVSRGAREVRGSVHPLPRRRLAQPGGRLLRHHRGTHRAPRGAGARAASARATASSENAGFRARGGRARRLQPAAPGR